MRVFELVIHPAADVPKPHSLTCRERKLKCDEKKPICGQCSKTGRHCQPSSGIVFRHHQNPSMNANLTHGEKDDLDSFYAYKDTFTKDNTWLPVSKNLKFIEIKDPYAEDELMLDLDRLPTAPGPRPIPTAMRNLRDESLISSPASAPPPNTRPSPPQAKGLPECQSFERPVRRSISTFAPTVASPASTAPSRTLPSPLSPWSVAPPPGTATSSSLYPDTPYRISNLSHTASPQPWNSSRSSPYTPKFIPHNIADPIIEDPEILFLMRHYTTVVGFSMDLFDAGRFFSDYVPARAMRDPLLKNACCAYAAKQLAMVRGMKLTISGVFSRPARTEYWPNPENVDWLRIATKYYDEAIHLLLRAVDLVNQDNILVNQDSDLGQAWQEGMLEAGKSDNLMAATAILCEYEAIDSHGETWQRHLSGTKSLLDIAEAGMKPLDHIEISQRKPRFSRSRRAIFWNFARQDFAAALITESSARLDVNNHQLWRDAGLELDAQGHLIPNDGTWIEYSEGGLAMREDMIANGLILILSKICNYLAKAESFHPPTAGISARDSGQFGPRIPMYAISQQQLLQNWSLLANEVEAWQTYLPDTFKPFGRSRSADGIFDEIWYPVGICAGAMANYHMARILLLINKPQESTMTRSTVYSRMDEYRNIVPECEWHGREIVGIALSRPETAVRIFLILPLFFAGQCFTMLEERRVVVEVLRSIEKDLGWATEYRVKVLMASWNYTEETLYPNSHRSPPETRFG